MTTAAVNTPLCYVDIYPYEGGTYTITGAQVIELVTEKNIFDNASGSFEIRLAPGGPAGANQPPSWTKVITPYSLVIIGMRRGDSAGIPMVGIVSRVFESQDWVSGSSVHRAIIIQGHDFAQFFRQSTFYALWYIAATGNGFLPTSPTGQAEAISVLGAAYNTGDPGMAGAAWFNGINGAAGIMAGPSGVLSQAFVPYAGGKVTFPQAMAAVFEQYDIYIPNGENFIGTEGSWYDKFNLIFPHPWYEFFVTTAPANFYQASGATYSTTLSGYAFATRGLGSMVTASPTLVARINPVPTLTATASNPSQVTFTGMSMPAWQALSLYAPESGIGFLSNVVEFADEGGRNFYTINPTWNDGKFGSTNGNIQPAIISFASAGDAASIRRYGFRPADGALSWMADRTGAVAQGGRVSGIPGQAQLSATLLSRLASWHEAEPLMARGEVTLPLRPDIYPGGKFRYQPFKDDLSWDFYLPGVRQHYIFGGPSTTTLTLARGLPTSVYDGDSSTAGVLFNAHVGNAMRQNGEYVVGLPAGSASGLSSLNISTFQTFFQSLGQAYITPQTP
jgi:hypothetical protein